MNLEKECMETKSPKPHTWRPWGDHPFVVFIAVIGSLITIYSFIKTTTETSLPRQSQVLVQKQTEFPDSKVLDSEYVAKQEKGLHIANTEVQGKSQELDYNASDQVIDGSKRIRNAEDTQKHISETDGAKEKIEEAIIGKWNGDITWQTIGDELEFTSNGILNGMGLTNQYKIVSSTEIELSSWCCTDVFPIKIENDVLYFNTREYRRLK